MGSSRLPGKVLRSLAGKPVLWHVIHRLRKCTRVDEIAIATSDSIGDDAIEKFGRTEGLCVIRGSESNVLQRYVDAAAVTSADVIVRVTGDAPMVDPEFCDRLIEGLIATNAVSATGERGVPCIHEGFSVLSRAALLRLSKEAGDDPVAREHVTGYFVDHPDFGDCCRVPIPEDCRLSARMSVDTKADLEFLEEVYRRLGAEAGELDVRAVVRLLKAEPALMELNAHVLRKHTDVTQLRAIVRCDGDAQLGMGHVVRCVALADELRESCAFGVTFAMASGDIGIDYVSKRGYCVERVRVDTEEADLRLLVERHRPNLLVLDVRTPLSAGAVDRLRSDSRLVAAIDDGSERRRAADLAFYPPVPQAANLDWSGAATEVYMGFDWVLMRRQFATAQRWTPPSGPPRVLVSMGGSDPCALTLKALDGLSLVTEALSVTVVLGPGFTAESGLERALASSPHCTEVLRDVEDMSAVMGMSHVAVVASGVTAYEVAAMGVPAVHLCLTDEHVHSSSELHRLGGAVSLGLHTQISPSKIGRAVGSLLGDPSALAHMSRIAARLVDGRGARRAATVLSDWVGRRLGSAVSSSPRGA